MKKIFLSTFFVSLLVFAQSQVINPPTINCVTTDVSNGDVAINWTLPSDAPCGPFVGYVIYGATSLGGLYLLIDTIIDPAQTSFVHIGANGTVIDWYYYMITLRDCPGFTSVPSDTVKEEDLIIPDLDYVTVVPGGVEVRWLPSPSLQTTGYIVYYKLTGIFSDEIDTVYGINNTFYFDTGANPNTQSYNYTVAAFDGCGNKTIVNPLSHNTIFLTASNPPCSQGVTLTWNQYINWSGVSGYEVKVRVDNNAPFIGQTLPDQSVSYIYSIAGITGDSVCFTIQAVHADGVKRSASNEVCLQMDFIRSTAFNYIRNITVNAAGGVEVQWYIDSTADLSSYSIRRGEDSSSLSAIETIPVATPVFLNTYSDTSATPELSSYYYQISSLDDCNFELGSTIGRTILLEGNTDRGGFNSLTWNAFELEFASVTSYQVYKVENGLLVPITSGLLPSELSYDDEVGISDDATFCYVVEATYRLDIPGFLDETLTSRSNVVCVDQPIRIYVPTAFVPEGTDKNKFFKPTLSNANVREYEFKVFDRWGKILFNTDLLIAGWDGTNKGEKMPLGGYAYYIRVVSNGGIEEEKTGMVVLVR